MQIDPSLKVLTPALQRRTDSNNWKLMQLLMVPEAKQRDEMVELSATRDIDMATGKFLDHIGQLVGEHRGQSDDEFYRSMIKARIAQRHTDGTIDDLYNIIAVTLDADPHDFKIRPMWNVSGESKAIEILDIPNKYSDSLQKRQRVLERISESVAADVRVIGVGFQVVGTSHLYVGSAVSRLRTHVAVMDYRLNRNHRGDGMATVNTAITQQRNHVAIAKEG